MKLLLVNGNTSVHVTERLLAQARRSVGTQAELSGVTARFGAAIIGSRSENAIAEHGVLDAAAAHLADHDAVIVGVSMDTAVRALRELLEVPVVGMTEAGLLSACMLGGRIGFLTLGPQLLPVYRELVEGYGLATRVASWRALTLPAAYAAADAGQDAASVLPSVRDAVAASVREMVQADGVDVVVLSGAVLAGYAAALAPDVPVPVVDCIEAAAQQAMALVRLRPGVHRTGSFSRPVQRSVTGVSAELAAMLSGPGGAAS